ncbi:MAG: hypothetical protein HY929_05175 [Euryarchaeota archaeon]|nr:hypothetical protein [Euryarchaeota archaeon]
MQSSIAGESETDKKIWYTYHSNALQAAREAIELDESIKVRPKDEDKNLICVRNSLPPEFSEKKLLEFTKTGTKKAGNKERK